MRAEELLRHYERVADAPDAGGRLRRLVLDLAVRGKLLPQDSSDRSQEQALVHARKELHERAQSTGRLRFSASAPVDASESSTRLPHGWVAARINDTWLYINGLAFKPSDWKASGLPIIRIQNLSDEAREFNYAQGEFPDEVLVRTGDILVSWSATLDAYVWRRTTGVLNQHIFRVIPATGLTESRFLLLLLKRAIRDLSDSVHAHGLVMTHINRGPFLNHVVWIPPLAEQHRIVAKVDELMALCDRLEAARAEREAARDRLAAASLARLNAPDPETFAADARFALDALPALTARPDQIKQLRKTILNLAVRGKLVTQDPRDQPAALLIAQIATETASQRLAGSGRRRKELPVLDIDLVPFELPTGWAWARFPDLGHFGRGKSKHRPRNDPALFEGGTHLLIQTGDVARSRGVIRTHTGRYNEVGLAQSQRWPAGTLCITIAANIADSGILSFEACFPDSVVGFVPSRLFDNARYFEYFVRTAKANLLEFAPATAQKNINLEILESMLIPLPPLNEQRRMVAKIDELMILCDQVELSLEALDQHVATLFDALIHKAVERADALGEAA